jgi:hypothetical protein
VSKGHEAPAEGGDELRTAELMTKLPSTIPTRQGARNGQGGREEGWYRIQPLWAGGWGLGRFLRAEHPMAGFGDHRCFAQNGRGSSPADTHRTKTSTDTLIVLPRGCAGLGWAGLRGLINLALCSEFLCARTCG